MQKKLKLCTYHGSQPCSNQFWSGGLVLMDKGFLPHPGVYCEVFFCVCSYNNVCVSVKKISQKGFNQSTSFFGRHLPPDP